MNQGEEVNISSQRDRIEHNEEGSGVPQEASTPSSIIAGPSLLFVLAILSSSFLIFLIQPMVGKRILPWYGGTPNVWTLCLAFYQTTLFLGYAYAHLLIRFVSPSAQLGVHAVVVASALLALPVLPSDSWQSNGGSNPSLEILATLSWSVAMPFIALASTGPLVQAWFANAYRDRSPYPLYAVSNIGSFAALIAYPFLLEPRLALSTTGRIWSYAFVVTIVAVLGCAFIARRTEHVGEALCVTNQEVEASPPNVLNVSLWVLFSGAAVILLMGVTNLLCLDVASVPFLWILPLATYLMTFIVCFASESNYRPIPYAVLTVIAFSMTLGLRFILPFAVEYDLIDPATGGSINTFFGSLSMQVPAYCAFLFGACMILHGELYRLRPSPQRLTTFYLCVSGGGALGGLFVGLVAPLIYEGYNEIRVGIGMAFLLFLAARALGMRNRGQADFQRWPWRVAMLLGFAFWIYALVPVSVDRNVVIHQERSFFSVLRVNESGQGSARQRQLMSGSTLHGLEFINVEGEPFPTSYYGRATGIAAAFGERAEGGPLNVGLIGLGVGTLSIYGREGDAFRYYEIDPAVTYIARDSGYFSFLETSPAEIEIVHGDARLEIAKEQEQAGFQTFDLLVLDAFSSDAIPVHLLTLEAFRIYAKALTEDGVLAVHVSNRYFDLMPIVARAGLEVGLDTLFTETARASGFQSQNASWIFLSAHHHRLQAIATSLRQRTRRQNLGSGHMGFRWLHQMNMKDVPLWTDDYSDLLGVLISN